MYTPLASTSMIGPASVRAYVTSLARLETETEDRLVLEVEMARGISMRKD
jgi:hypothetical protein